MPRRELFMSETKERATLLFRHYWSGKTQKQMRNQIQDLRRLGAGPEDHPDRLSYEDKIQILKELAAGRNL